MRRTIIELMTLDAPDRDALWLFDSLQATIELEHATLPPYLCGMWSIQDKSHEAYDLIRSIAIDEMKHMALACNMLTAIGGDPQIATPDIIPKFPGNLPGGVLPDLNIWLQGLTKDYVRDVFMAIEAPEHDPIASPIMMAALESSLTFDSIGEFYAAILDAFKELNDNGDISFQPGRRQITGGLAFEINSIDDVEKAIHLIQSEGEGSSTTPFDNEGNGDLAHYYKFAELYYGRRIEQDGNEWKYTGSKIEFPNAYPMAPIPAEGLGTVPEDVKSLLDEFNRVYTKLLIELHDAWNTDNGNIGPAISTMYGMESIAVQLMKIPKETGRGNYGPTFEFLEQEEELVLEEVKIFPPLAIARLGSSNEPLENYQLEITDSSGYRSIKGAETLRVDKSTGTITEKYTPDSISFRDSTGKIKPVAPFFEVWGRFENQDHFVPLTKDHLQSLGLSASWQARLGNYKAYRRTGDEDDKIKADSGVVSDFLVNPLEGKSNNFKDQSPSINLGSIQAIQPTDEFPELRLRFTPAAGKVFGPEVDDVITAGNDVYDVNKGGWQGHIDTGANLIPSTSPGRIYASAQDADGNNNGISLGYLDDSCDGVISVTLSDSGDNVLFKSAARVSSGPPDFAPDSLPPRTVTDDLSQMILGIDVDRQLTADEVIEIVHRSLETVNLMSTDYMNISGMVYHDNGQRTNDPMLRRAIDRIFTPQARAGHKSVSAIHRGLIESLEGLKLPADSIERSTALGTLVAIRDRLRRYNQVGDLSNAGRARMPALMRNSDGMHLALTRRQIAIIEKAIDQFQQSSTPNTGPEANMKLLIASLSFGATQHGAIPTGFGNQNLGQLFSDPDELLNYLKNSVAKGSIAGDQTGQALIVAGDPNASAFYKFITDSNHPMNRFFASQVGMLNKTGVEIVEEWILSL